MPSGPASKDRKHRQTSIEIVAGEPFHSAWATLIRSAVLFFTNLPFLASVTLAVFLPGKLLVQFACNLLDVPSSGFLSYVLMDLGDLVLGSMAIAAAIYGLAGKLRTGQTPPLGECLRWGRRLWGRMLWNKFKVEITVLLWSLLFLIPGLIAMVKLALVDAIVAVEGDREPRPLDRSIELTTGHRWKIFAVLAPIGIVDMGMSFGVLGLLPGVVHSPVLMAVTESALAIVGQWTTAAVLLIYLGTRDPLGRNGN